jgi:hypothetical protein
MRCEHGISETRMAVTKASMRVYPVQQYHMAVKQSRSLCDCVPANIYRYSIWNGVHAITASSMAWTAAVAKRRIKFP